MSLISVIIPIYNAEKYLDQCLQSIISQEFSDLEIILVNDGSRDHSAEICDAYKRLDPRICVIHKENGGQSSARNMALKIAKGKYVCFVDSDDFIPPKALQRQYMLAERYHLDMLGFNPNYIDENGKLIRERKLNYPPNEVLNGETFACAFCRCVNPGM